MRKKAVYRVYPDTSVFGGMHDDEFSSTSRKFFELVKKGNFVLVVSPLVTEELKDAPKPVQELYTVLSGKAEFIEIGEEALELRDAYIKAGVVTERWSADALHVALATVAGCDLIVSWNFRHIVHFQKVPQYNAINRLEGYRDIGIYTPQEVIYCEK